MKEEGMRLTSIKSVKQITDDLKQTMQEFDHFFNCHDDIPKMSPEEDLHRLPTMKSILKDLPSEQRLKEMLDHPLSSKTEERLRVLR